MAPEALVNLDLYPIDNLASEAARRLVARCSADLKATGACVLPDFLRPEATSALAVEAEGLAPLAYHNALTGNAYLEPIDETLDEGHPKKMTETTALGAVAYDQIPSSAGLRRLYESELLIRFLEAALGRGTLYRYGDPMGALNIAVMGDGDYLRWHFDQTDFVTSIALQSSDEGGEFEYVPMIRTPSDERFPAVKQLLSGSREGVITLPTTPGSLILFEGRYSIHRVTTIKGRTNRLMALLGYDTKPDVMSTEHLRKIRYGRSN
jgi:hypothetical protein